MRRTMLDGSHANDSRKRILRPVIATFALLLLALGLRSFYVHQVGQTPYRDERRLLVDARYYDMRAGEIASGDLLGDAPGFLSPGYCGLLGAVYFALGNDVFHAKIAQAALGALSCVLLYWIGRIAFGDAVGLLAGAGLAVYGTHVYYTGVMLPTVYVLFVNLLLMLTLALLRDRAWLSLAAAAGLVAGLAAGAKANALLLVPLTVLWIWIVTGPRPLSRRLALIGLFLATTLAAIAPITYANYRVSSRFVPITTTGGVNLMKGNGPQATGSHVLLPATIHRMTAPPYINHQVDPHAAIEEERSLRAAAWRHMRAHPARTLALFGRKVRLLFNAFEPGIRDHYYFARTQISVLRLPFLLSFGVVAPLGLVGAALSLGGWRRWGFVHGVLAAQVVSFVLVFVLARYRLVAVACLLLFAAWLVVQVAVWARDRRGRPLSLAFVLLLLAALFVHWPVADFSKRRGYADQYDFIGDHYLEQEACDKAIAAYRLAADSEWQNPWGEGWRRSAGTFPRRFEVLRKIAICQRRLGRLEQAAETLRELLRAEQQAFPGRVTEQAATVQQMLEIIDAALERRRADDGP